MGENAKRQVILVDDDEDVRALVQASIGTNGTWDVRSFATADEALNAARADTPDVFLLDVMMPGTDGVELFGLIRRDVYLRSVPVVFLTAKAAPLDAGEYLTMGAHGVIVKPFNPASLSDELEHILEKGHEAPVHWPKEWTDTTA
ncbi:MAG: response regulator [Acidimicrobiia bacterium]